MTTKETDINNVYWCEQCQGVTILKDGDNCNTCNTKLINIGFTEEKKRTVKLGGRTTPGNCKCGNPLQVKGTDHKGRTRYRSSCSACRYKAQRLRGNKCAICSITAEQGGPLEVDHIDGDRSNNALNNLQTLCKPCHIYKTNKQKDWKRKVV